MDRKRKGHILNIAPAAGMTERDLEQLFEAVQAAQGAALPLVMSEEAIPDAGSWPDDATGTVLLMTRLEDRFFKRPSEELSPMLFSVCRGQDGALVQRMAMLLGGFRDPRQKEAWSVFTRETMAETGTLAVVSMMEGWLRVVDKDTSLEEAERMESLILIAWIGGKQAFMRTTTFVRSGPDAAPVATRPTSMQDLRGDGEGLSGRMVP